MRRMVIRLWRALSIAALLGLSGGAAAQEYSCNANYCTYGPFCVDAWGGCFFYSWWIGSGVNTVEEKSGLAPVIKLCTDPQNPDPTKCVQLTSTVQLLQRFNSDGDPIPNVYYQCRSPGADTCTDASCGGSPSSSGQPYLASITQTTSVEAPFTSDACVKEKGSGAIKCSKTNTVPILEGQDVCPNKNWQVVSWPLLFTGVSTLKGPLSKQSTTPVSTTLTTECELLDHEGNSPSGYPKNGYNPLADPAQNKMVCKNPDWETPK